MEKRAISKYNRIAASKVREVTKLIQGKPVEEAMAVLSVCPRRAATLVLKTLKSAVANAENAQDDPVSAEDLLVKEAVAGEGPTMKRFRPKARGMAGRIRRRTSHVRIIVTDQY